MINGKRVVAIIPARSGSKGLPGKNIRELCGKPLIAWSIEQGRACEYIDLVLVSTDSEEIANIAEQYGASVPFRRPAALAADTASTPDVLLHAIDYLASIGESFDYLVLLEPTSPLRTVADITGALEELSKSRYAESIVGVAKAEASHPSFLFRLHDGLLNPMSGAQPTGLRRQDLKEDFYYLEGSVYVSSVESFRAHKTFYHEATAAWVVDRYKALEIDELSDFLTAEALMKAELEGLLK
jgi:N-acylneuraminate cytidylyltransferase/CMP-N,N'-diacetyllegionaminic acid synthase